MVDNNKAAIAFIAVFLLFLCLVTYGDILTHQFMIDDHAYIKPASSLFCSYRSLGDFFTKAEDQHYSPFNLLLNVGLFGFFQKPLPFYAINLTLFYINLGLWFAFVFLVSRDLITALLTAVIFCLHPMTAEMLQHITLNILLMQTIFMESGLIALYLYSRKNNFFLYLFSLLMSLLALFCHETALLFPLYAAALLFYLTDLSLKRIIKLLAPFIFLGLFLIFLWVKITAPRIHVVNMVALRPDYFWNSSANFSHVFFWYVGNLFVSRDIVFMCHFQPLVNFVGMWNLRLFGFAASCAVLIFCYFKKSIESFSLLLFLTGFLYAIPAVQARFMGTGEWVLEPNWLYFSSVGLYLFIVLSLLKLRTFIPKWVWMSLLSAFLAFCFISTLRINVISRTEASYCGYWLRKFPGTRIPMNLLANFYRNNVTVTIPSDFVPDMLDMVDVYIKYDYPQKAFQLMERIASSDISFIQKKELSYRWADYYCKSGQIIQCRKAVDSIIGPEKAPAIYMRLSLSLYQSGADRTAHGLLKECMGLYPQYKEPYLLMGVMLANEEHYKESLDVWKRGALIDPSDLRFTANIRRAENLINEGH